MSNKEKAQAILFGLTSILTKYGEKFACLNHIGFNSLMPAAKAENFLSWVNKYYDNLYLRRKIKYPFSHQKNCPNFFEQFLSVNYYFVIFTVWVASSHLTSAPSFSDTKRIGRYVRSFSINEGESRLIFSPFTVAKFLSVYQSSNTSPSFMPESYPWLNCDEIPANKYRKNLWRKGIC